MGTERTEAAGKKGKVKVSPNRDQHMHHISAHIFHAMSERMQT